MCGHGARLSRRNASNQGLTVDFAQMQKDKRYYSRLKAAEKASKKAKRYQSTEDAKMSALREQFGLDRLTAAANGQNLQTAAASASNATDGPSMTSPQPAGHGKEFVLLCLPLHAFVCCSYTNADPKECDSAALDVKERLLATARQRAKS